LGCGAVFREREDLLTELEFFFKELEEELEIKHKPSAMVGRNVI
jgi:hypothetical protein